MKDMGMNNKNKLSFTSKVMFGVLALVIVTGLGAATYAAGSMEDKLVSLSGKQIRLFNPFTLQGELVSVTRGENSEKEKEDQDGNNVNGITLFADLDNNERPPVRIPYRPALRSPYRPPLVP